MSKILFLLIISLLIINFTSAAIQAPSYSIPTVGEMVPVIDFKAVQALSRIANVLDSVLSIQSDLLLKLYHDSKYALQFQYDQLMQSFTEDAYKSKTFYKNLTELGKFIQLREDKSKNLDTYNNALEEARIAGVYVALENLPQKISCLNPRIRYRLINYAMDLSQEFDLMAKAANILDQIPDCITTTSQTTQSLSGVKLPTNIFAWLIEPFKLNLAQINQSPQGAIPAITITPAFQQTEDSIELSDLQFFIFSLIQDQIKEKEQERKNQIDNFWQVEIPNRIVYTDSGKVIVIDWTTLMSNNDLDELKKQWEIGAFLPQTINEADVYSVFLQKQNILNLTKMSTSSLISFLLNTCQSYNFGAEFNRSLNYALCLRKFNDELKTLAETERRSLQELLNLIDSAKTELLSTKNQAQTLRDNLISTNSCTGAITDLENIVDSLETKIILYTTTTDKVIQLINQNDKLINDINNVSIKINKLLDQLKDLTTDVITIVNRVLEVFKNYDWLNADLSQPIIEIILNEFGEMREDILNTTLQIITQFQEILNDLITLIYNFNNFYIDLLQLELNQSAILNDLYDLNIIQSKLTAYSNLDTTECISTNNLSVISMIKNPVIIVEAKKQETPKFNFLALIQNLFKPKLVEIINGK